MFAIEDQCFITQDKCAQLLVDGLGMCMEAGLGFGGVGSDLCVKEFLDGIRREQTL